MIKRYYDKISRLSYYGGDERYFIVNISIHTNVRDILDFIEVLKLINYDKKT